MGAIGTLTEGDNERLLVIDDEEKIAPFLQRVLSDLGYQATAFNDGATPCRFSKKTPISLTWR